MVWYARSMPYHGGVPENPAAENRAAWMAVRLHNREKFIVSR
jgi:hypothetical protein